MLPIHTETEGKPVLIASPPGSSGLLHLYIDGFYRGQFIPYMGRWDLRLQKEGSVLASDVQRFIEMVEQKL